MRQTKTTSYVSVIHKFLQMVYFPFPVAGWPSKLTSLTLRVCLSRTRRQLASLTPNSWRRSDSMPRAARSTASWASVGASYPSNGNIELY